MYFLIFRYGNIKKKGTHKLKPKKKRNMKIKIQPIKKTSFSSFFILV